MNRRNFIKAVAAGVVASQMAPADAGLAAQPIANVPLRSIVKTVTIPLIAPCGMFQIIMDKETFDRIDIQKLYLMPPGCPDRQRPHTRKRCPRDCPDYPKPLSGEAPKTIGGYFKEVYNQTQAG